MRIGVLAGLLGLFGAAPAGAVGLAPCPDAPAARCGTIVVPAFRSDPSAGTMRIAFRRYPALSGHALHTVLAIEGGPGYPSTGSADYYLAMLGPSRRTTTLVVVDQRGTGASELIDCAPLQDFPYAPFAPVALAPYRRAVTRCGALLGSRSDAYGTGAAVDDMIGVLDALGLARVDVYGDSYGSYAAQTLALRHPGRIRSLILDGAYPIDYDPWARDALAVLRAALRAACDRSPTCPWASTDPVKEIAALARRLRARPLKTRARDAGGTAVRVRLDGRGLAGVLAEADGELTIYRDIPAAVEAYSGGDRAPLARLAAEAFAGGANGPARSYSAGLRRGRRVPRLSATLPRCGRTGDQARSARGRPQEASRRRLLAIHAVDVVRFRTRELRLVCELAAPDPCPRPPRPAGVGYPRSRRSCWMATSTSARR